MAFKMKGSPMKLGSIQGTSGHASALKKKSAMPGIWDTIKSAASDAYDKASQVGMGAKAVAKDFFTVKGGAYDTDADQVARIKKIYTKAKDEEFIADNPDSPEAKAAKAKSDAAKDLQAKKDAARKANEEAAAISPADWTPAQRAAKKSSLQKRDPAVQAAKDARKAKRKAKRKATSDENLASRRAKQDARRSGETKAARKAEQTARRVGRISGATKEARKAGKAESKAATEAARLVEANARRRRAGKPPLDA